MASMLRRVLPEDIDLQLSLGEPTRAVRADAGAVEQMILNLVNNARDAMPDGGELGIEVKETKHGADRNPARRASVGGWGDTAAAATLFREVVRRYIRSVQHRRGR